MFYSSLCSTVACCCQCCRAEKSMLHGFITHAHTLLIGLIDICCVSLIHALCCLGTSSSLPLKRNFPFPHIRILPPFSSHDAESI